MNKNKINQIKNTIKSYVEQKSELSLNEVRVIVALERAIARLLLSDISNRLIFKGGFVILKCYEGVRFTRDADVLAISITKSELEKALKSSLLKDLDDGFWFGDIKVQELNDQDEGGSSRFSFAFQIGQPDINKIHKLSRLHIDVGFKDYLPSLPTNQEMALILTHEEPISWKIYPIEYIISEKIQTLYDRGSANSRAKDVFDLVYLIPKCKDLEFLKIAIRQTFSSRNTKLPKSFVKVASELDNSFLKSSWPGVKVENKQNFETTWKNLIELLKLLE